MRAARRELELFFLAMGFFTRLPVPAWVPFSEARLARSARYFPLVGLLVGGLVGLAYLGLSWLFGPALGVALSMALSLRLTGAFHEDGFADACDGLGGGFTKTRVLEIMKDSRLGTYGVAGLTLMLAAKGLALYELSMRGDWAVLAALVAAHPLSRFAAVTLNYALPYVREDEDAKAKPLAKGLGTRELLVAAALGIAPAFFALAPLEAGASALAAGAVALYAARLFLRRLGGYTGDLLGATQQGAELSIYLTLLALDPLMAWLSP